MHPWYLLDVLWNYMGFCPFMMFTLFINVINCRSPFVLTIYFSF
jgi:hypothetical protein